MGKTLTIDKDRMIEAAGKCGDGKKIFETLWPEEFKEEHGFIGEDFEWVRYGVEWFLHHKTCDMGYVLHISQGKLTREVKCKAPGIQTDDKGRILLDEE